MQLNENERLREVWDMGICTNTLFLPGTKYIKVADLQKIIVPSQNFSIHRVRKLGTHQSSWDWWYIARTIPDEIKG